MRKLLILFAFLLPIAIFTSSCTDDSDAIEYQKQQEELQKQIYEQFGKDTLIIQKYLSDHQLTATKHVSGIYYIINEPGDEYHPNDNSYITVNYKGYLTDGTVFDQTKVGEPNSSPLYMLILGWRHGIPLIGTGGKITLFLPSFYGYASAAKENIPANSVLIFEVELVSFE
jgi:FKBP-type peptidyl-prolyl cis-trans isomerase FkpA